MNLKYNNIPQAMRDLKCWVAARPDKLPVNPKSGDLADTTNPNTWGSFGEAVVKAGDRPNWGIGFVLSGADPYTIIDLDNHEGDVETTQFHYQMLEALNETYIERSRSGNGYHIIIEGIIPRAVKGKIEMYSDARYMIMTGDAINRSPISARQDILDSLFETFKTQDFEDTDYVDGEQTHDDEAIYTIAAGATNGDKFVELWNTEPTGPGGTDSESDSALLNFLCTYSKNDEQVRRLFGMTKLGRRERMFPKKLNKTLKKVRLWIANENPPVDMKEAKANAEQLILQALPKVAKETASSECEFPPGLIGEAAEYIYSSSIRPVKEVALLAAIGLMAGIAGRAYNTPTGTGLNMYLMLVAPTGRGKEGIQTGIENIIAGCRRTIPSADRFIGPGAFASGQALVRSLDEQKHYVSVMGEFGLTLQSICDPKAGGHLVMLRRAFLDLFTKSGANATLQPSVYSDKEKNTQLVRSPAVTLIGEGTPTSFFDGLGVEHIADGLIPRFSVLEYTGKRPPSNPNAGCQPPDALTEKLGTLMASVTQWAEEGKSWQVPYSEKAAKMLDDYDKLVDRKINETNADALAEIWNRAHLKAIKLACLQAVSRDPYNPNVSEADAKFGIDFTTEGINLMVDRFSSGNVGSGDSKQLHDLRRVIHKCLIRDTSKLRDGERKAVDAGMVPYRLISTGCLNLASFTSSMSGATPALRKSLETLVLNGELIELSPIESREKFNLKGKVYSIGLME